jgi:transposase
MVQSLNKALDEVRIRERKGNDLLKGHKYTVLKKYDKLSRDKKSELEDVLMMYPRLGEAYRLREHFLEMFSVVKPEESKGYLWFWCGHGYGFEDRSLSEVC